MIVRLTLAHYCLRAFTTMRTKNLLFPTLLFCGSFKARSTDVPPGSFAKKNRCQLPLGHHELTFASSSVVMGLST